MALDFSFTDPVDMLCDFNSQTAFDASQFFDFDHFFEQAVDSADPGVDAPGSTGSTSQDVPPNPGMGPKTLECLDCDPKVDPANVVSAPGFKIHSLEGSGERVPRFRFSKVAITTLEESYQCNMNPRMNDINELAKLVHAKPTQVGKWFSNRRNRERKQHKKAFAPAKSPSFVSIKAGDYASSVQQASASSPRNDAASSATTPDWSSSSVGIKRKSVHSSSSREKMDQSHGNKTQKTSDIGFDVTYQCTVCYKEFSNQPSWQRHEETICYPQRLWTCLATGWYSCKGEEPVISSASCAFCELMDPPPDHATVCKHRIGECLARPIEHRQFQRKDGLRSHCKQMHNISPSDSMIQSWKTTIAPNESKRDWDCGFCGTLFTNWHDRIQHIASHFKQGLDMSSWLAAGKIQLRSLLIGGWSFESLAAQDLRLTYLDGLGIIAYTINWGLRKVALRFSVGDIASIKPDLDELEPWKREDEEAYIIELNTTPQFFFLTSDGRDWQRCEDFTESHQASSYFGHTLIGHRNSQFTDMLKEIDAHRRRAPAQNLSLSGAVLRPPMVLWSSRVSRYCPFCSRSPTGECGSLSHSMYTACSECGKRMHREHNCTDPGNFGLGSIFVCRGKLQGGRPWGCGAKFEIYTTLWLHLTLDPAGAACLRAFTDEQDEEREGEDLADLFSTGLRLARVETVSGDSKGKSSMCVATIV